MKKYGGVVVLYKLFFLLAESHGSCHEYHFDFTGPLEHLSREGTQYTLYMFSLYMMQEPRLYRADLASLSALMGLSAVFCCHREFNSSLCRMWKGLPKLPINAGFSLALFSFFPSWYWPASHYMKPSGVRWYETSARMINQMYRSLSQVCLRSLSETYVLSLKAILRSWKKRVFWELSCLIFFLSFFFFLKIWSCFLRDLCNLK